MTTFTADQLPASQAGELARWHAGVEAQSPAQPCRTWRADRIADLTNLLAEAHAWNAYADQRSITPVATDPAVSEALAALEIELAELLYEQRLQAVESAA